MNKRKSEDDSSDMLYKTRNHEQDVCVVLSSNEEDIESDEELCESDSKNTREKILLGEYLLYQSIFHGDSLGTTLKETDSNCNEANQNEEKLNYDVLNKILKDTKQIGDYAVADEATNLPTILGLEVEGFGPVSFPLLEPTASSLIKVCSQAPYGHNFNTLVNKAVRDSYQLNPSQIKINNKYWKWKLGELVEKVCRDLGVKGNVEAKLYKMLIYEKGGHFLKHRDTEKEKGMFATLVLQLPSIHEGGELVVYNGNQKKVYDFGQSTGKAPYLIHYAAHYADLEHELLEVKSGYRTALVYSLCWKNGNGFCPSINIEMDTQLPTCLSKLSTLNKRLAISLDHQYTPQALMQNGTAALKGIDNDRFNLLKTANEQLPIDKQYSFYIVHMNLVIDSSDASCYKPKRYKRYNRFDDSDTEYEWEENRRWRHIKSWYDAQGTEVTDFDSVDVSYFHKILNPGHKKFILNDEESWNVEDNEIEGYTGNAEATKTTTYGKYLLAIWPQNKEFDILLEMDLNKAINLLTDSFKDQIDNNFTNKLNLAFNFLYQKSIYLSSGNILGLMQILENYNDLNKCKTLIEKCVRNLFWGMIKPLCNLIKKYEWCHLRDSIKDLLERNTSRSQKNSSWGWFDSLDDDSIQIICNLTKILFDQVSPNVALELYNQFVVPILSKLEPFPSSADLVLLIQTVKLFPEQQETQLNHIKRALISLKDKTILENHLKELINKFSLDSLKKFKEVFEYHLSNLKSYIPDHEEFSWQMPFASVPGHPRVENFLRGNEQTMIYGGAFSSLSHARDFAFEYSSENHSFFYAGPKLYSVMIEAGGRGKTSYVLLVKTKEYFQEQFKKWTEYKEDIKLFSSLISKF